MTTSIPSSDQGRPTRETVDVSILREIARNSLVHHRGVSAPSILHFLFPFSDGAYDRTQQHGIDKMFWLESGPLSAVTTSIVYLCRPQIKWVKIIAGIQFPSYYLTLLFIADDRPDQAT